MEYIDEDSFDNEYDEDYDEEDQDYDMENEVDNDRENEEHLDDDPMIEEHLEDDQFCENTKENRRQDLYYTDNSNHKNLTNGTHNHITEKPSTSEKTAKKEDPPNTKTKDEKNLELLKLFTDVQNMQKQATSLKKKLKIGMKVYKRQNRTLERLKEEIEIKKNLLVQRRKKKSRILLSLQDKIKEDTSGLVLAMPTRHTDELKNFALSVYKYSPQAYIYIRNTLRTILPSTDVLDSWLSLGYEPKNVLTNSNLVKVISELTDTELSCKVSLR